MYSPQPPDDAHGGPPPRKRPAALSGIRPPSAEDLRAERADEFEEQMVIQLCVHYGVPTARRNAMKERVGLRTGTSWLNFSTWYDEFPGFPVYFGCCLLTNLDKEATVARIMRNFGGLRLVREFDRLEENRPDEFSGRPLGLLLRWPNLAGPGNPPTGLVLHNRPVTWDVSGVRIIWSPPERKEVLVIEPLSVFLKALDQGHPRREWMDSP